MDLLETFCRDYCNWGKWGPLDQRGTANYITQSEVAAASALIRKGDVISVVLPLGADGPQSGEFARFNPIRLSTATGTDHVAGRQRSGGKEWPRSYGYADDVVIMPLQSATHWDALSHIFHKGRMWNGYAADAVSAAGAQTNGVENLQSSLVGRAVLLDIARSKGVAWLERGYAITIADLELACKVENVEIREGDIVLLRTGEVSRCRVEGWGAYAGGDAPGLSFHSLPWIADNHVAAVASDTWGVEVRPNELPDSFQPFHIVAVVYLGLLLGENFDLERIAAACAEDGIYEMLFAGPPIPVTGGSGAPPSAVVLR